MNFFFVNTNNMSNELLNKRMKFKIDIIMFLMLLSFSVIIFTLFKIIIFENEKYDNLLNIKTGKIYKGQTAPRGNIYDRNGVLLVGNEEVKIIKYRKSDLSDKEEIDLAILISENIELEYNNVKEEDLVNYIYTRDYDKLFDEINNDLKEDYNKRKISSKKLENIIKEKIDISLLTDKEKKEAYVYSLMNKGYRNEDKVIKNENVSESEVEFIENLDNFYIGIRYIRYYPFNQVLKSLFGSVGPIPKEDENEYLEKGYFKNDLVGVSYLEKEYEEYLKGTDETYKIKSSGEREIITELKKGNDLYLTIDINLQNEIENIVKENMIKAKKEPNTEYYNKVYAIVGNAYDGAIYAFVGENLQDKNNGYFFVDNSLGLITDAITPGSSVKGASHIVGYETGAINYGYKVNDGCIKIKNSDEKCSWKRLGIIDDLTALKYSSNYYQFLIAIKIGKGNYVYNAPLKLDKNGFNIYRSFYNQFGLGVKTGIDLSYESVGFKGDDSFSGSLLDFPIGQYDNYTPVQMFQYISTVYNNGTRVAPHLGNFVKEDETVIYNIERNVIGGVKAKIENFERVKLGLKMVMERGGTGSGYINLSYNPIGKTGTAQSFIDTNMDGKIDTETVSTAFVGVAEGVTFVVLSPNVSSRKTSFTSKVNKRITKDITDLVFLKYKINIW